MQTLNENEKKVLAACVEDSKGNGHDFGVSESVKVPAGITRRQFAGYMSQLVQKGYIMVYGTELVNGVHPVTQFVLTDEYKAELGIRQ